MAYESALYMRKCSKCHKEVYPTPKWVYKDGSKYYCSWKCFNHRYPPELEPKRKILRPEVGDTIETLYIDGIQDWQGRIGVVRFYDCYGQMHGTWGKFVVIPGEDRYRIVRKKEDNDEK